MRSWGATAAFLLCAAAAAGAPLLDHSDVAAAAANLNFPGWPTRYDGRVLTEMALTDREAAFLRGFPGRVGRFWDGRREIIIRWVGAPTRRLHSAASCFRAVGYGIAPTPVRTDAAGSAMGCFRATRQTDVMIVCEVIRGARGESWSDVSAWYWAAMFGSSPAPWWVFVVAERE